MTTIVYRDGIMAADRQVTGGGMRALTITKIFRNKKGDLAGGCGNATILQKLRTWFEGGEKEPLDMDEDSEIVVARVSGLIEVYLEGGFFQAESPYYAAGSGAEYAMGAMAHGASAVEALSAACKHDVYSGSGATVLTHVAEDGKSGKVGKPKKSASA